MSYFFFKNQKFDYVFFIIEQIKFLIEFKHEVDLFFSRAE